MTSRGFSLVELLVVLAVASVLMALVGPLGFESVERVKTQTEVVAIQRWYNKMGHTAFIQGQSIEVRAQDGGQLVAIMGEEVVGDQRLNRLSFTEGNNLVFSASGIPSRSQLALSNKTGQVFNIEISGALSVRSAY